MNIVEMLNRLMDDGYDADNAGRLAFDYRTNEDRFYVIDGQHRLRAASMLNQPWLPCRILVGLSAKEEAIVKVLSNTSYDEWYLKAKAVRPNYTRYRSMYYYMENMVRNELNLPVKKLEDDVFSANIAG